MSNGLKPADAEQPCLGKASTLTRLALIGVALAAVVTTFAYFGGWFTPNDLTPARFTDGFEHVDGAHSGFRRNHAKGVGVSGFFESNGNGVRLSKSLVFQAGRVSVIGRFSLSGGQPYFADMPDTVRGLALQFSLPDGELWRTAMINLPVVPVSTPEAFYEQLIASKPDPSTGKPDPASLNAFRFINSAGDFIPVRWLMTPMQAFEAASTASAPQDKNYLFDTLIAQIDRQPLRWHLMVSIGQPGDPTNDATIAWPEGRQQVDVGTLTLDRVQSEETSAATDINFDPLVLPAGIAPSGDPLLSARSAVYSQSFTRRAGETKQPSAITPADVRKGE